jgi:ribosomal protein S18 acetylase RimI-like enzyme
MFEIAPAAETDFNELVRLRSEATKWLSGLGVDQWQQPWPTRAEEHERLRKSIEEGTTWKVLDHSEIVATFAIDRIADPHLWLETEQAERALYVHRLIIDRSYAGVGLGAKIMDLIATWAAHEDCRWLRIDVWTNNTRLHNYYRNIGFRYVRTIKSDYPSGALFQREVSVRASFARVELPQF